jgi:pimeloyl-ACP methyl ester carboxylesterase
MDSTRRNLLATGVAAAAMAAAPQAFGQGAAKGRFYEKGNVRIHYQDVGSGPPLLIIPGGGLNSTIEVMARSPFNAIEEFRNEYRCITADLRMAYSGQSSGPLEVDRPWDSIADDQLGLMDHLGLKRFMVLGYCIGGPMIWNLLKRAPDRIIAAVISQPSGWRKELPTLGYDSNMKGWGPELVKVRSGVSMETVERFLTRMYRTDPDFVYTVTRDDVRACRTPVLVMPDDSPPHPFVIAMESAMLAQQSEVSMYPWKDTKEKIPLAVRQVRTFMRAHRSAIG